MPWLEPENQIVYEVYFRVFNVIENDPFKIMDMIGIEKDDRLFCLDLIQGARNEVLKVQQEKGKKPNA